MLPVVAVEALTRPAVQALCSEYLDNSALAARLASDVATASQGVALHVLHVLRDLEETGAVRSLSDGSVMSGDPVPKPVAPRDVQDSIRRRLARVGDLDRAVLDAAGIHGTQFDPVRVAWTLRRPVQDVLECLVRLERGPGLVRTTAETFFFEHDLVREVVYGDLHAPHRRALHGRWVVALDESAPSTPDPGGERWHVERCHHGLRSDDPPGTLPHLASAVAALQREHRWEERAAMLRAALSVEELLVGEARVRALLPLEWTLQRLGQPEAAFSAAEEAWSIAEQLPVGPWRVRASAALGFAFVQQRGDVERAAELLAPVEAFLESTDDVSGGSALAELRGDVATKLGVFLAMTGRLEHALDVTCAAVASARATGVTAAELSFARNVGNMQFLLRRLPEAGETFRELEERARAAGYLDVAATALIGRHLVLHEQSRFPESESAAREALRISRDAGDGLIEMSAVRGVADALFAQSLLGDALAARAAELQMAREYGTPSDEAGCLVNLSALDVELGDFESARARCAAALGTASQLPDDLKQQTGLVLARVCELEGDVETATEFCREVVPRPDVLAPSCVVMGAHVRLGALLLARGDREPARTHLETALRVADLIGVPGLRALTHAVLAEIEPSAARRAEHLLHTRSEAMSPIIRLEVLLALAKVDDNPDHTARAKEHLAEILDTVPIDTRVRMVERHPAYRDLVHAG